MTAAQVSQAFDQEGLRRQECEQNGDGFFSGKLESSFTACWYRDHLEAMSEHPLNRPGARAVRFLWLRTFDEPVMVRVDFESDDSAMLVAKELDGSGGYLPGCLRGSATRRLHATEARRLRVELADAELIPRRNQFGGYGDPGDPLVLTMDGARWILERVDPTGYRIDDPTSPGKDPSFIAYVRFCRHLLELADIHVPDKEMY
jgi:hypothetical protein